MMQMRALCCGVLLAALAATSCRGRNNGKAGTLPPPPALPSVDGGTNAAPASGAPRALAAAIRAAEQAPPDRRFLLAFGEIDRLLDGVAGTQVVARRTADGGWAIESTRKDGAPTPIAQLPDGADFEPMMDALAAYASRRAQPAATPKSSPPAPLAKADLDVPMAHEAFASLSAADAAWKTPAERPLAARRATNALVGLVFGTHDKLEVADELRARAIATAAVARALGARPPASVEALLARVLGYGAAALRLAPDTPNDAVAAYAADDDVRLLKLARSSTFARHAWLRRLVQHQDPPGIRAWIDRELARERLTVPLMAAQTMQSVSPQLETYVELAARFPAVALAEALDATDLAKEVGPAHARVSTALAGKDDRTDAALAAVGTSRGSILLAYDAAVASLPRRDGPFRDTGLERDYLDTNMVAAMTSVERYYVYGLGSPELSAREVGALLEPTSPRTKAFRVFFQVTVAATSSGKPDGPIAHITATSPLGGWARFMMLERFSSQLRGLAIDQVGSGVLGKLDSRPAHQSVATWVYGTFLKDAHAREQRYRAGATIGGGSLPEMDYEVLRLDRDPAAIERFARRAALPPGPRARAVAFAMSAKLGESALWNRLADDLMRDWPLDWGVRSTFVSAYGAEPKRVQAIARDWLDRKAGAKNGGLGDVHARVALSASLRGERKYEEALRVIEPAAATWQQSALLELAVVQALAGHPDDADRTAVRARDRYPQSSAGTSPLAYVRWMRGDMDGAAAALATAAVPLNVNELGGSVASSFAFLFADKEADAARAAQAIRTAKQGQCIPPIAAVLIERKAFAAALAVLQAKADAGPFRKLAPTPAADVSDRWPFWTRALTFEAIRGAQNKAAALAWLRTEVGSDLRQFTATLYEAFGRGMFDMLDAEVPAGQTPEDTAEKWTMKLAAQLRRDGHLTSADEARRFFATVPTARYASYGRYLLGDIDADTVEKLASSPKQTCELAYYMGVKALGDGRHADAVGLLRVATKTSSAGDAELRWADGDLIRYVNAKRALASLPAGLPGIPSREEEEAK
jgi:hypothetical protein